MKRVHWSVGTFQSYLSLRLRCTTGTLKICHDLDQDDLGLEIRDTRFNGTPLFTDINWNIMAWTSSHWYTKMCTICFLPDCKKCVRLEFRGLKIEGVRNSVVAHCNQFDSVSAGSIGHVFSCQACTTWQDPLQHALLTTWVAPQQV